MFSAEFLNESLLIRYYKIKPLLPSVFDDEDAEQVIQSVLKNSPSLTNKDTLVIGRSSVTSNAFVDKLTPLFSPLIEEKAKEVIQFFLNNNNDHL